MTSPVHISPDCSTPTLLGIKQHYVLIESCPIMAQQMKIKNESLKQILSTISFNQCLVFSNYQSRAESISNLLQQDGWPILFISGNQDQKTRLKTVESLQQFKCRILSSTDLTARGIDAANIDLVINYDVPNDVETYLHRMGRAGRYGSYGTCITLVCKDGLIKLRELLSSLGSINITEFNNKSEEVIEKIVSGEEKINKYYSEIFKDKETQLYLPSDNLDDKRLFDIAIKQLTQLMLEPQKIDNISSSTIDNIKVILKTIETEYDQEKNNFQKQVENSDCFIQLLKNKILSDVNNEALEQDNKRRKLNDDVSHVEKNNKCSTQNENSDEISLFNIAIKQLTQLILDPQKIDKISSTNIEDIKIILKSIETENDFRKNKFQNIETVNSFIELLKSKIINNVNNETLEHDNKRRKLNNDESSNDSKDESAEFQAQQNIALYNIVKCMSENNNDASKLDCSNSIERLLKIISSHDEINDSNLNEKGFIDFQKKLSAENMNNKDKAINNSQKKKKINTNPYTVLPSKNLQKLENDNVMNDIATNSNAMIDIEVLKAPKKTTECKDYSCIDKSIVNAYRSALSHDNIVNWDTICDEHNRELLNGDAEDTNTQMEYECEGEWEEIETEHNFVENEEKPLENDVEIYENLFIDAYRNAIGGNLNYNYDTMIETDDSNTQLSGFAVDTSYQPQKPHNFTSKTKRKFISDKTLSTELNIEIPTTSSDLSTENFLPQHMREFINRRNSYKNYLKHYSNVLMKTAPLFTNADAFRNWYKMWLDDVETVRQFVHHDIYDKEFKNEN